MNRFNKIEKLRVFVIITSEGEKLMSWPDSTGVLTPLVYLSKEALEKDNMREIIQNIAKKHNLFCELREYQLVSLSEERFYSNNPTMNN